MPLPVIYRRAVGRDLAGAYRWYEDRRPGLGEQFLTSVNAAFDQLERFPELFAVSAVGADWRRSTRRWASFHRFM